MPSFLLPTVHPLELVLRAVLIYAGLLIALRIFGKREVGQSLTGVMDREGVDQAEVEMSMREHGVVDLKEVQLAVLEPDGTISVVPTTAAITRTKHRIRYHHRA